MRFHPEPRRQSVPHPARQFYRPSLVTATGSLLRTQIRAQLVHVATEAGEIALAQRGVGLLEKLEGAFRNACLSARDGWGTRGLSARLRSGLRSRPCGATSAKHAGYRVFQHGRHRDTCTVTDDDTLQLRDRTALR